MDLEALVKKHDSEGMSALVENLHAQMEDAWEIAGEFSDSLSFEVRRSIRRVVVCGMGGSAIGADMLRAFAGCRLEVPVFVYRDYSIPGYVLEDSLLLFSSYSGDTGETLSCYEQTRTLDVPKVAVTSGGRLKELCKEDGVPCCIIPSGFPPRAAIAYSLLCAARILDAFELLELEHTEFLEARDLVHTLCTRYSITEGGGEALELAKVLEGRIPFVYACDGVAGAVARRWACQFNENSKVLAHYALFTELCHNEIVGWENLGDVLSRIVVIALEDEEDHAGGRLQMETTLEIIAPLCYKVLRYKSRGKGRLARMLSLMTRGDFASVYLALLYGVDPTPVEKITFLKSRLRA